MLKPQSTNSNTVLLLLGCVECFFYLYGYVNMFSIILRTKILGPVVSRIYTNHKKHSEIFNNISHNTVNYVKAKITRNIGTRN